jgi:uncharacterized protein YggE
MRFVAFLLLTAAFISSQAQTSTILSVQGSANRLAAPDLAVMSVNLMSESATGSQANQVVEQKVLAVQKALKTKGYTKDNLKVGMVSVQFIKSYNDNRPDVYRGSVIGQIELAVDPKEITSLVEAIQGATDANVTINFTFKAETQKRIQDELIAEAVTNARDRADIIAGSIGKKIADVKQVSYSDGPVFQPRGAMMEAKMSADTGIDFSVQEGQMTETVMIDFIAQ